MLISRYSRNVLQKRARLGNDAEFTMLQIVYSDSEEEITARFGKPCEQG